MGGLGNYMFQITTAYSLALDNEDSLVLNNRTSVSVHKHIDTYRNNILRNLTYGETTTNKIYSEPFFHYNEIPYTPNLKLNGYYQSEKYFKHNRDKILECFSIDDESRKYIDEKYDNILKNKTCSIHVRRGDYLGLSNIHPTCSINYYGDAMKQMDNDTVFLVFSDDIEWCKQNIKFNHLVHFVEGNEDYMDMWLMSLCDNNIIANSSFSWWGAWLNNNPNKKVIVPKKWFGPGVNHNTQDLIPESWITI
jgi:hypothetical protein